MPLLIALRMQKWGTLHPLLPGPILYSPFLRAARLPRLLPPPMSSWFPTSFSHHCCDVWHPGPGQAEVISTSAAGLTLISLPAFETFLLVKQPKEVFFFMIPKILDQISIARAPLTCSCGTEMSWQESVS